MEVARVAAKTTRKAASIASWENADCTKNEPQVSVDVIIATWTPKVCKIMAFIAVIMGLGLFFYMLLGFR